MRLPSRDTSQSVLDNARARGSPHLRPADPSKAEIMRMRMISGFSRVKGAARRGGRPRGGRAGNAGSGARHGGCSWAAGMNEIALGVKRSFYGFLRITRKPFASVGLTAARFDLLYAVRAGGSESRVIEGSVEMRQSRIRRCLGVTPTVVSRMVRSLEQLGLVVRRREAYRDRRQMRVILTAKGLHALKAACSMLLRSVQRFVYEVICYGRHRDPMARFMAMGALESYLSALREYLGDTATLRYPWGHPDD